MDNHNHLSEVLDLVTTLLAQINGIPCHPKNKLLVYHRFVLSKILSFTIASLGKTWVVENIDNHVTSYIHEWLELPICAALSTLILPKSKYGINCILPSTTFLQCQTVIRNVLTSSPNSDSNSLWAKTSCGCNIQHDQYMNAKQVLTAIQNDNESHITYELKSQGFIISCILTHASSKIRSLWSIVQQSMPKKILNLSIKYLNNTLATRKNQCKWSISQSAACSFCLQSESLQHVVSSCKSHLEDGRYTWHHNLVILSLAKPFSSFSDCLLYADLPSFLSPSDLVFVSKNSILYTLELIVGFESNIQINSDRKASKYSSLLLDLRHAYSDVKFVNLSVSTIGIMGKSSESLLLMLDDLTVDKPTQNYLIRKVMNIAIRCTYYIFCCRNKPWSNPNLLDF